MVSGRLAAGTPLGTSARAWSSWLEAGRELSRELPNTSGDACAINAPARSTQECRQALSAQPWRAVAHITGCTWCTSCQPSAVMLAEAFSTPPQHHRRLHLSAAGRDSSSGKAADNAAPDLYGPLHRVRALTDLSSLAQDWHQHVRESYQRSCNSGRSGHGACICGSAAVDTAHHCVAEHITLALVERTCTLLDQRLGVGTFAAAPAHPRRARQHVAQPAGVGSNTGGDSGGGARVVWEGGRAAAAAADPPDAAQRHASAKALAEIITSVASCHAWGSRSPPVPPPDLVRSLVSAATAAAHTAPWPQATAMLEGMLRMRTVGKRFLDRVLTRAQRIPAGQVHIATAPYLGPHDSASMPPPARRRAQGIAPEPTASAATGTTSGSAAATLQALADEAGPGAEDAVRLLRSLSILRVLLPAAGAANLGGAMQRLMLHLQARLHALPGPRPLLGLLRDLTSCGWRHDREPEFMRRIADYLCTRTPPPELAGATAAPQPPPTGPDRGTGTGAGAVPAEWSYSDGDDDAVLVRPPRLLALTPSQVVEVLDLYARAGVYHAGLMERGLDAVDSCLPGLTPSQAARVAEACARFSHHRPALMRRLGMHVAAHLQLTDSPQAAPHLGLDPLAGAEAQPEAQRAGVGMQPEAEGWLQLRPAGGLPVAPGDVAAAVAALARCRVRDERLLGAVAAFTETHARALLAEMGARAREHGLGCSQAAGSAREQEVYTKEGFVFRQPAPALGAAATQRQQPVPGEEKAEATAPQPGLSIREAAENLTTGTVPCGAPSPCGLPPAAASRSRTGDGLGDLGSSQGAVGAAGRGAGAGEICGTGNGVQLRVPGAGGLAPQTTLGLWRDASEEVSRVALPGAARGASRAAPAAPTSEPGPEVLTTAPTGSTAKPGAEVQFSSVEAEGAAEGWWQPSGLGTAIGEVVQDVAQALPGSNSCGASRADEEVALLEALLTPPAPDAAPPAPPPPESGSQQLADSAPPAAVTGGQRLMTAESPAPLDGGDAPCAAVWCGAGAVDTAFSSGTGAAGYVTAEAGAKREALVAAGELRSVGGAKAEAVTGAEPRLQAAAAAAAAAWGTKAPAAHGVSLERLAPDRTALVIRRLSPVLQPRALLRELLAVPGANVDLFYMPYDYAAVSRGRPGLGCAFVGVTSAEGVEALARRLQAGPLCGGAELAVLEHLPSDNSNALLRALLNPQAGYSPQHSETTSRPLLLYVSGALRGKVQPVEARDVALYDLRAAAAHATPQLGTSHPPHLRQQHRGQWHEHPQQLQQQQQQLRLLQVQQQHQWQPQHQLQPPQQQQQLLPGCTSTDTEHMHRHANVGDCDRHPHSACSSSPLEGCGDGGQIPGPPHATGLLPTLPDLSRASARHLLDVSQLALIAHSMAVLSYHPPDMLGALDRLMQFVLQPVHRNPRLASALLPPAAADEAGPGLGAAMESGGGGEGAGGERWPSLSASPPPSQLPLPPRRHCLPSWPAMPPLKSVLHSLHALASKPHPDPAAFDALADVCAGALAAWTPSQACSGGPLQSRSPLAAADMSAASPTRPTSSAGALGLEDNGPVSELMTTAAAGALPPPEVLDVHARLLAQVLTAAADRDQMLYHPRLCDAAAALLRHRLQRLRVRAACALLQPLVRLRYPPAARLVSAVAPLLAQDCGRLSPASLVDLAWACARTGLRGEATATRGGGQVVRALALRTRQLLQQLPSAGMVQMFWALATMGYDGGSTGGGIGGGPDLYWQLLQALLQRYDLIARDLLLLQEGMELLRRRRQGNLEGPPGLGPGLAEPLTVAAVDPDTTDLMEAFLQELMYRAGGAAEAAEGAAVPEPQARVRATAAPAAPPPCRPECASDGAVLQSGAPERAAPATPPHSPCLVVAFAAAAEAPRKLAAPPPHAGGERGGGILDAAVTPALAAAAQRHSGEGDRLGLETSGPSASPPSPLCSAGRVACPGQSRTGAAPWARPSASAAAAVPRAEAVRQASAAEAAAPASSAGSVAPGVCVTQPASLPAQPLPHCAGRCNAHTREACTCRTAATGRTRGGCAVGDGVSGGCRYGRWSAATSATAAAAAAASDQAAEALAAPGGLQRQILIARRGLVLEEADGLMMRLQVPEALLARAGAVTASATSSA